VSLFPRFGSLSREKNLLPQRRQAAKIRKGGDIITLAAGFIVALFGLFLIGLAILCVFRKQAAERFLSGFASSARAHFTEHSIRFLVGVAFVLFSPSMWYPQVFNVFGWILIVTSAVLLVLPWAWHREYARRTVPTVLRILWLFAIGSLALGVFVFYGLSRSVL